jgi:hypothetical protein
MNFKNFLKESVADLGQRASDAQKLRSQRLQELDKQKTEMAVKGFVPSPQGAPTKLGSNFRRAFFYDPSMDKAPEYTVAEWHQSEQEKRKLQGDLDVVAMKYGADIRLQSARLLAEKLENKLNRDHDIDKIQAKYKADRNLQDAQNSFQGRFDVLTRSLTRAEITSLQLQNRIQTEINSLKSMKMGFERRFVRENGEYIQELELYMKELETFHKQAQTDYLASGVREIDQRIKTKKLETKEWEDNRVFRDTKNWLELNSLNLQVEQDKIKLFLDTFTSVEILDKNGGKQVWAVSKVNPKQRHLMYSIPAGSDVISEAQAKNAVLQMMNNINIVTNRTGDGWPVDEVEEFDGILNPDESDDGPKTIDQLMEEKAKREQPPLGGGEGEGSWTPPTELTPDENWTPSRDSGGTASRRGISTEALSSLGVPTSGPTRSMRNVGLNDNSARRFNT